MSCTLTPVATQTRKQAMALSSVQAATLQAVFNAGGKVPMTFRAKGCNVRSLASLRKIGMLELIEGRDVQSSAYIITLKGCEALYKNK